MSIPTTFGARLSAGVALPFRGLAYLAERPALWPFAVVPVLLTIAGLIAGLVLGVPLSAWLLGLLWTRPEGWWFAAWWLARAAVYLVVVFLAAFALPSVLSAPATDQLSARVEALELGAVAGGGLGRAVAETWRGLANALLRILVFALGHALLLFTLFVPPVYPVLAFLWTARWTAVEYLDLPMARNLHRLGAVRAALRAVSPMGAGFGGVLALALIVPLANLVVVPVGAVGSTLLYCELVRAGVVARIAPAPPPPAAASSR